MCIYVCEYVCIYIYIYTYMYILLLLLLLLLVIIIITIIIFPPRRPGLATASGSPPRAGRGRTAPSLYVHYVSVSY